MDMISALQFYHWLASLDNLIVTSRAPLTLFEIQNKCNINSKKIKTKIENAVLFSK